MNMYTASSKENVEEHGRDEHRTQNIQIKYINTLTEAMKW